ncbi:hypothetical protein VaNZ11_013929, partial [Volvox africanus]
TQPAVAKGAAHAMHALTRSTAAKPHRVQAALSRPTICDKCRSSLAVNRSMTTSISNNNDRLCSISRDLSDVRSRWLPDQPTFVCPPSMAQGSPSPSDQAWAERGIFLSYGKVNLSYKEVERLLQLANLDINPSDFRSATEVVWAYRYQNTLASSEGSGTLLASDQEGRSCGAVELIGFAAAEVAPPGPLPSKNRGPVAEQHWRKRQSAADTFGAEGHDVCISVTAEAAGIGRAAPSVTAGPGGSSEKTTVATVWFLAVHPALRGQGLGRALLERIVSELRAGDNGDGRGGASLVTLRAVSRATAFYDRLGLMRDPALPLVRAGRDKSGVG